MTSAFDDVLLLERHDDGPRVVWRYLTDPACGSGNNNFSLPYGLPPICVPGATKGQRRGAEFTFTISDGRSRQLYGLVKQVALKPETPALVACILAPKPLYVWLAWILRLVHARLLHDPTKRSTMTLLNAIRGAHHDGPLVFADSFVGDLKTYTFPLHPPGAFGARALEPHILNYRSFTTKLQTPSALLVLLSALLLEQRVVVVHDEHDLLTGLCQLLLRLLSPLVWKHMLIPVLPMALLHYASAPIPYLLGMTTSVYKATKLSNVVIFHLDAGNVEFRDLLGAFPTLCDEFPISPTVGAVPFARLGTPIYRDSTSALAAFRRDLLHAFEAEPETLETCVNALLYHLFADASSFLRSSAKQGGAYVDLPAYLAARRGVDPPLLHRFVTAIAATPMLQTYCNDRLARLHARDIYHGPLYVCIQAKDFHYAQLRRNLQRRSTQSQEYPQVTQLVAGMWTQSDRFHVSLADVRPLLDATYHMDHCGIVIDMLWERLGDGNDSTVATALQILVYLMLDGCEIVTEYLRFKECQRNHCRILKRHSFRGIVHGATQLLDFMSGPERLYTIRTSNSTQQWLSKVTFPRLELKQRYALPAFGDLHHNVGRFYQPVHSVDLLNLHVDDKKQDVVHDPFDTNATFPEHWR
ncbi:hypothetical protein SPRG_21016 [Saprolegnia parasitica CBS 223.65]|uniref:UDENN domain-containing protein n=1 Tax=Saprolegnia parasitica (strain CBS 223.65) TaxID=695850 RepID=A0A067BVV2_SAPPC|nr:hypothetical protein SPRG_21016 [Saprolegnia parasitica CBS 223.65]KDO22413.1 hypothetical protein SPRG_21016 [Saprolegnia parasitica CBS 223.65]|eukprot:XP_012206940.1 hypothetical protein SPRG_21016 [Saprolegnia parasitica CBS 223.65]